MSHYQYNDLIAAPASAVYEALTTLQGIRGWWTTNCEVGSSTGENVSVRFGETFKVMRLDVLQPFNEVCWSVIDSHLHVPDLLSKTEEWIGTRIVFRLSPHSTTLTQFQMDHFGLTPHLECYGICAQGWSSFLGSLKQYVETGVGSPYVEKATVKSSPT